MLLRAAALCQVVRRISKQSLAVFSYVQVWGGGGVKRLLTEKANASMFAIKNERASQIPSTYASQPCVARPFFSRRQDPNLLLCHRCYEIFADFVPSTVN